MNQLVSPIIIECLQLAVPERVVKPLADFSSLPYFDGRKDVNGDVPFLSEDIVALPLRDLDLTLPAGNHLHWTLPFALTQGDGTGDTMMFPTVPDRWLVSRESSSGIQQWVVESNYLFLPDTAEEPWAVPYPLHDYDQERTTPPFRYMGRALTAADWVQAQQDAESADYFHPLTAVGYGETTFAAFYPNCFSIFGFHDANPPQNEAITYSVVGWYARQADDFCQSTRFTDLLKNVTSLEVANDLLTEHFHWTIAGETTWRQPERLLCCGQVVLPAAGLQPNPHSLNDKVEVTVALGNTATEALSALLAKRPLFENDPTMEDKLESLHLLGEMRQHHIDIGPKFREARHSKAFRSVEGGTIWVIKPVSPESGKADAQETETEIALPPDMGALLNGLNVSQQKLDQDRYKIDDLRARIFADWYKYMQAAYPSITGAFAEFEIDALRFFIEGEIATLATLEASLTQAASFHNRLVQDLRQRLPYLQMVGESDIKNWTAFAAELRSKKGAAWETAAKAAAFYEAIENMRKARTGVDPTLELRFWLAYSDRLKGIPLNRQLDQIRAMLRQHKSKPTDMQAKWLHVELPAQRFAETVQEELKKQMLAELARFATSDNILSELNFPSAEAQETVQLLRQDEKSLASAEKTRLKALLTQGHLNGEAAKLLREGTWRLKSKQFRFNRLVLQSHLTTITRRSDYSLHEQPGPRFWQPNEPVILLNGEGVVPMTRYAPNEVQTCRQVSWAGASDQAGLDALLQVGKTAVSPNQQTNQPWNPFLLEWEVQLYSNGSKRSNSSTARYSYRPNFIKKGYRLKEHQSELSFQSGGDKTVEGEPSQYIGRSILTPGAKVSLQDKIEHFLESHLEAAYLEAHPKKKKALADNQQAHQYYQNNRDDILNWYEKKQKGKDPFVDAVLAVQKELNGLHILAQSLSGFNDALLGQKATMQLPIADPLGGQTYRQFASRVAVAVNRANRVAPEPNYDFQPIRTGHLQLLELRLVDSFGQARDVNFNNLCTSDTFVLADSQNSSEVQLPPRLMVPTRLNLRWLANGHGPGHEADESQDNVEMNSHPAMSPICGWLLANNLDGSLMLYDKAGRTLGYFDPNMTWREEPGSPLEVTKVGKIANPHLRRVARWLKGKDRAFLQRFISMLDSAQENINPASFAQHLDLALLMGRPIAVVRSRLSLEQRGLTAVNQSGTLLQQTLKTGDITSDEYEQVRFPVRLGEHRQLNDGLIGYWREESNGKLSDGFFSPQGEASPDPRIITWHGEASKAEPLLNEYLSLTDEPCTFTMLFDPRGRLHATSGFLPTKSIDIPADQFANALSQMEVSFLSTPILTEQRADEIDLPIPIEAGYRWSWREETISNGSQEREIKRVRADAHHVGKQMIRDGWLVLKPSKTADNEEIS